MTLAEAKKLPPGLYRVFWKIGGSSEAAVGMAEDGTRWLAPTNWVAPCPNGSQWRYVDRVICAPSSKAEHLTLNQGGVGSTPTARTK
jgi:hypothetical protein